MKFYCRLLPKNASKMKRSDNAEISSTLDIIKRILEKSSGR